MSGDVNNINRPIAINAKEISAAADNPLLKDIHKVGKTTSRLQIVLPSINSRFFFSTMKDTWNPIKLIIRYFRYVPIKISEDSKLKTVYVNVGSLANRLLLTEKEIWAASSHNNGDLEKLILERTESVSKLVGQLQHYEYEDKDTIRSRHTGESIALGLFFRVFQSAEKSDKIVPFEQEGKRFLGGKVANVVHVLELTDEVIGKGNFGVVSKVQNIGDGTFSALKVTRSDKENAEDLDRSYFNEQRMLEWINSENREEYLQGRHFISFELAGDGGIIIRFLAGTYYPGENLSKWVLSDHTEEERIDACKKLSKALEAVAKKSAHGDLKPENIRMDAQGKPTVIDWGGACKLEVHQPVDEDFLGTTTENAIYSDKRASKLLDELSHEGRSAVERAQKNKERGAKLERSMASNVAKSKNHAETSDAIWKAKKVKDDFHKLLRYQDFHAMRMIYMEVLSGIRTEPEGRVSALAWTKIPERVQPLMTTMFEIDPDNFSESDIAKYKDLWQKI